MARKGRGRRGGGSLPRGVYRSIGKAKPFAARISAGGRSRYLGVFSTLEEAASVAAEAYKKHFSEGGRHEADGF